MHGLMRYAAELDGLDGGELPPVHLWNPDYCGELDLLIRRDGTWVHEGTPVSRARLVRLFSTVLKREKDRYYLVTPVEKLGIRVEDVPFIAVSMHASGGGKDVPARKISFITNVGDRVVAGSGNRLFFRSGTAAGGDIPYIHVRAGLEARIARSVYYELVSSGSIRDTGDGECSGIWSDGVFFPFESRKYRTAHL